MDVIALRRLHGAESQIGRHCSTLAEMRLSLLDAVGDQRAQLLRNIERAERDIGLLLIGAK